ncbi:MAG: hypothetical protein N3F04_05670 [Candidatus Nezhaarchaeota archaeon]|nr:hypothetical protein [Candidatus Nezhaarchaeota archaeon]MCX8142230.1 hypothetical protein [Candidatus Nezhaarchaeota archaeon]MDW8050797.1 hypothetical protein [Nitrososphaerota archaeon]
MSKALAASGAILALSVLALLYLVPLPQPYAGAPPALLIGEAIWSYRAIDMLAQAFLILAAACGVTALFRIEPLTIAEEEEAVVEAPLEEEVTEEE